MAEAVSAVLDEQRIKGDGWSLRADYLELINDTDWRAVVGVRNGLNLMVTWSERSADLDVEAWEGEPEETDGIAIIDIGDGDVRLARIPLCSCGVRGCGNSGLQFAKWLPGEKLPELVELFRELSWTDTAPSRSNVLRGDDLAAIDDSDVAVGPGAYLYAPGTGEIYRLRPEDRG